MVAEPPLLLLIAIARARKPKDQAGMPLGIWRHNKASYGFGYRGRLLAAYCSHVAYNILEEGVQKKLVSSRSPFESGSDHIVSATLKTS